MTFFESSCYLTYYDRLGCRVCTSQSLTTLQELNKRSSGPTPRGAVTSWYSSCTAWWNRSWADLPRSKCFRRYRPVRQDNG